jgi:hypothetical protein
MEKEVEDLSTEEQRLNRMKRFGTASEQEQKVIKERTSEVTKSEHIEK